MIAHRISTLAVLLAALAAVFYVIPAGTEVIDYGTFSPGTVPTVLAWIIAALALVQLVLPQGGAGPEATLTLSTFARAALIFGVTLLAVWLMPRIGFLPAAIGISATAAFVMQERRPVWLGLCTVGLPVLIWAIVTQLLDRTLP